MGIDAMGRVHVTAKIENLADRHLADRGFIEASEVRGVEVDDAVVDLGAIGLAMPMHLIRRLGLEPLRHQRAATSDGIVSSRVFGTARLTIQGRDCPADVTELPDECPVRIGRVLLHALDFVVDPANRRLIGNPAHGGEQMLEMY